jgi:hypothetical protein
MMQYVMIVVALVILFVLIWMEIKRPVRSFLLLRLLASITAVVALLFLVIPFPYFSTNKGKKEIILLSEGYNKDSVDHFLNTSLQSFQQFHLNDFSIKEIAEAKTIHLFGNGFKDTNQIDLPNVPIVFHASDKQSGIQTIHWQQSILTGSPLLIQGSCSNFSNKSAKLVLYGWNKRIDSIELLAGKQQQFSFTVVPENEGRGLYHLALMLGKDSIEKEIIAYQVKPAKALKVLMLGSSPDFETKFIKNWLADFGNTVISKTSISKGKFQNTFSNASTLNFEKLTTALLEEQDLVVSDEAAIQSLTSTELAILKQAISDKGLGLILNADSVLSKKNFIGKAFDIKSADSNTTSIKVSKLGESNAATSINLKHPFRVIEQEGMQPLFVDQQKRVFAAVTAYGKGKLIVNTLQKTSSWLLSDHKKDYSNYWSILVNQSAKKEMAFETWNIQNELPRANEAISIVTQTNGGIIPRLNVQQNELYAKQNVLIPSNWEAIYWPIHEGWQTNIGTKGAMSDWYVYPSGSWNTFHAIKQVNLTKEFLRNRNSSERTNRSSIYLESYIPPIYLLMFFLMSMSFLWVERKFQ